MYALYRWWYSIFMWQCDPNSPPGFALRKPCPGKLLFIQSTITAPTGVFVGLPVINTLHSREENFGILDVPYTHIYFLLLSKCVQLCISYVWVISCNYVYRRHAKWSITSSHPSCHRLSYQHYHCLISFSGLHNCFRSAWQDTQVLNHEFILYNYVTNIRIRDT